MSLGRRATAGSLGTFRLVFGGCGSAVIGAGFDLASGFAPNGHGAHAPGSYSLAAALVAEIVLTFMFLIIILGATEKRAPAGFVWTWLGGEER